MRNQVADYHRTTGEADLCIAQVRIVLVALGDRLALNRPACALYRPHDPDQQDRADKPGNQVADPST